MYDTEHVKVEWKPMPSNIVFKGTIGVVIEHCTFQHMGAGSLQFDDNVRSICAVKDTENVEFVSDVLYDARVVRSIWFAAEEQYFMEAVRKYCEEHNIPYVNKETLYDTFYSFWK